MPYLQSKLLTPFSDWLAHGFFTREEGFSKGMYKGRNCSPGSGDNPDDVQRNRQACLSELSDSPQAQLFSCYQIHGDGIIHIEMDSPSLKSPKADGLFAQMEDHYLGILTADCIPILFVAPKTRTIAAIHTGWKGAHLGLASKMIQYFIENKAAESSSDIIAVIGPGIDQASYEVGKGFYAQFNTKGMTNNLFFKENPTRTTHYLFNIKAYLSSQLKKAGVTQIDQIQADTYSDSKRFYSFRRATHLHEHDYGRQISIIGLRKMPKK